MAEKSLLLLYPISLSTPTMRKQKSNAVLLLSICKGKMAPASNQSVLSIANSKLSPWGCRKPEHSHCLSAVLSQPHPSPVVFQTLPTPHTFHRMIYEVYGPLLLCKHWLTLCQQFSRCRKLNTFPKLQPHLSPSSADLCSALLEFQFPPSGSQASTWFSPTLWFYTWLPDHALLTRRSRAQERPYWPLACAWKTRSKTQIN